MPAIRPLLAAAPAALLALGVSACATRFAPVDPAIDWSQGNSQGNYAAASTAAPSDDPAQKKKTLAAH
ncbi:MAG: hypothetical protein ISP90_02425 [Nevskia sp.]|nr:hypothetical protein [Nevskia sp.]